MRKNAILWNRVVYKIHWVMHIEILWSIDTKALRAWPPVLYTVIIECQKAGKNYRKHQKATFLRPEAESHCLTLV